MGYDRLGSLEEAEEETRASYYKRMAAMIDYDQPKGTTQFLYPQMQEDPMRLQGPHISRAFDIPPSLRVSGKTDNDLRYKHEEVDDAAEFTTSLG